MCNISEEQFEFKIVAEMSQGAMLFRKLIKFCLASRAVTINNCNRGNGNKKLVAGKVLGYQLRFHNSIWGRL